MTLYQKYRPTEFEEMIGNEDVLFTLQTRLIKDPPHAFLFHGPTGCGKTTLARIIAKELGCKGSDFREIDSADFRGIDTIREIRRQSQFMSLEGPCRVWLLDECHKLSNDAQNALLKGLEDTPKHVYFILATTDPQKLISTIKGRCYKCELKPFNDKEMLTLLRRIVKGEEEVLRKEVYDQIVTSGQGLPRNAIQILEQVLTVEQTKRLEIAKKQEEVERQSLELCRALFYGKGWKQISDILSGLKDQDPETIRRQVLGYSQAVLLKEDNIMAGAIMEAFIEPFYNSGFPGLVFACYSIFDHGD